MNIKLVTENGKNNDAKMSNGDSFTYHTTFKLQGLCQNPAQDKYEVDITIIETTNDELKEIKEKGQSIRFTFGSDGNDDEDYFPVGEDHLVVENPSSFTG